MVSSPYSLVIFWRNFFVSLDVVERNGTCTCWTDTFISGVEYIVSLGVKNMISIASASSVS
jgi:hypothetical protein